MTDHPPNAAGGPAVLPAEPPAVGALPPGAAAAAFRLALETLRALELGEREPVVSFRVPKPGR